MEKRCKHILVFESDNIQMSGLVDEIIRELGCDVKMSKTIVTEVDE